MQKLKLSARTVQILKNFASINPSIQFNPGSIIKTMKPGETIIAEAMVIEKFESSWSILDLSRFLGVMSLFNDPELEIGDTTVTIVDGNRRLNYVFADPATLILPIDLIDLPSKDIVFKLTPDDISGINKVLNILALPEIVVRGDGKKMFITVADSSKQDSDTYDVGLGKTAKKFSMVFKAENLKLIQGGYDVIISGQGMAKFTTADPYNGNKLVYTVIAEHNSKYGE